MSAGRSAICASMRLARAAEAAGRSATLARIAAARGGPPRPSRWRRAFRGGEAGLAPARAGQGQQRVARRPSRRPLHRHPRRRASVLQAGRRRHSHSSSGNAGGGGARRENRSADDRGQRVPQNPARDQLGQSVPRPRARCLETPAPSAAAINSSRCASLSLKSPARASKSSCAGMPSSTLKIPREPLFEKR